MKWFFACVAGLLIVASTNHARASSEIYHTSFTGETLGSLSGQGWTFSTTGQGWTMVDALGSHTNALVMTDDTNDSVYSLNEATLQLDLSTWWEVGLDFTFYDSSDEEHHFNSNFTGSYNADGIAISDDGVNWIPFWDVPDDDNNNDEVWKSAWVSVDDAIVNNNLNRSTIFLKFQQYDNYFLPKDGRGWDNIWVQGLDHSTPAVPEPGSLALFLIGAVGLLGYRFRFNRTAARKGERTTRTECL